MPEKIPYQPTSETESTDVLLEKLNAKETRDVVMRFIYSKKMRLSQEEVQDVIQDTMFKAIRAINAGKYRKGAKLSSWLCTLAQNTAIDLLRRKKFTDLMTPLSNANEAATDEPTSQEKLTTVERDKNLKSLRNKLPPEQREVLELFEHGLSLEEIAKLQNVAIDTIKSRKRYALQFLRKSIKNEGQ